MTHLMKREWAGSGIDQAMTIIRGDARALVGI